MAAPPKKTRSKVGVIGLGIIGTRVAANLRSTGHQVYVWSRTPRAAPNFLGSVVEVADLCDVIQLFVSDDGALNEVIRTIAAALRPRHAVLCHATVSPAATRRAAAIVEAQGARYLDAPFTGSKAAAQNRQLVYYIGGAKPALEEVRPVLAATSKAILHLGNIGDATVVKIATNMITASTVQTLAEALALVRAAGIDASRFVEALENNGSRSGTSDLKLPAMIAGNTEPNFSLGHMLKDVRLAQELADQQQLSLPVTDTTAEVFSMGIQNGWADEDFSIVAQLYPTPASTASVPAPAPVSAEVAAPSIEVPKTEPAPAATIVAPHAPAKPAPPEIKALTKVSEKELAGLALPPRPAATAPAAASSNGDKSQEKSEGATTATNEPVESALVDKKTESTPSEKKAEPALTEKKNGTIAIAQPKKPVAPAVTLPALNAEEVARREKKGTLQLIRDFFKPVPTERR